jgi:predicted glycosyltransferase involved in capsule biosynthesis
MPEVSYIIPVSNGGRKDFPIRCGNLQYLYDNFLMRQQNINYEVIFASQTVSKQFPPYQKRLRLQANTRVIELNYPTFNKGWCINVAVKAAKSPIIFVAEADCFSAYPDYLFTMTNIFRASNLKWSFGWDGLQYLTQYESAQVMRGDQIESQGRRHKAHPGGPEGGILVYDRDWYLKIGGHNEWVEGLGGPDNEMADRAKWWSKTYSKLPGDILHLWHPTVKGSYHRDPQRLYNKQILNVQRSSMAQMAPKLARAGIGNPKAPACSRTTYYRMRVS